MRSTVLSSDSDRDLFAKVGGGQLTLGLHRPTGIENVTRAD